MIANMSYEHQVILTTLLQSRGVRLFSRYGRVCFNLQAVDAQTIVEIEALIAQLHQVDEDSVPKTKKADDVCSPLEVRLHRIFRRLARDSKPSWERSSSSKKKDSTDFHPDDNVEVILASEELVEEVEDVEAVDYPNDQ